MTMAESDHSRVASARRLLALGVGLAVIIGLATTGAVGAPPDGNVSEEAYVQPAPDRGDPYFEAAADDGSWVSYENPRDEYRSPYLGDGSGKLCVTLLNENGKPVIGESVPNTTVTIPTGGATTWHSEADPMTVTFPMDDHYDFPLDGDQFGTSPDVGWDTDIDPIDAAEPYEEAGGGWTYNATENATHAQAVVVLQLDAPADERFEPTKSNSSESNESQTTDNDEPSTAGDTMPGFGVLAAIVALSVAVFARYHN